MREMSITTKFPSQVKTFQGLFQPAATGYYIPNYQRPYSWNKKNVTQLISDVITGTHRLVDGRNPDEEYRFLGTIITVTLPMSVATQSMFPVDQEAVPTAVSFIIDGQQRLSTIAILAMALHDTLSVLTTKISKDFRNTDESLVEEIIEICRKYHDDLTKLFALNLGFGNPKFKPVIIRADDDKWTKNGNASYTSDLAKFISQFCDYGVNIPVEFDSYKSFTYVKSNNENNVGKNYDEIRKLLGKSLESEEFNEDNDEEMLLPTARALLDSSALIPEILMTTRPRIMQSIQNNVNSVKYFVQVLGLSYFLTKRCLVNHVEPQSEAWAFDMFQALNSTGEPLTAFDIFKAVMLQRLPSDNRELIKNNIIQMYDELESFLGSRREEKLRKTNDLLIILGLSYAGEQVIKLTSEQKKWLTDMYEEKGLLTESQHYQRVIKRTQHTMRFIKSMQVLQESKTGYLPELAGSIKNKLRDEAMFSLLFLRDARHSIVDGALNNTFYQIAENSNNDTKVNFCHTVRAVTAFYALWWPIYRTNKLPKIHRDFMSKQGWKFQNSLDSNDVKRELCEHLASLPSRKEWIEQAADNLRYGAGSDKLVRFALFVSMWNTTLHNGHLVSTTSENVSTYLTADRWCSEAFSSIEHIAPQTRTDDWDDYIYPGYVNRIGNLVLLATETNAGTGNKSWADKWIYYSHTAETDIAKQNTLREIALQHGVTVDDEVVNKLQKSKHNDHLLPILQLGISYKWDKTTIDNRSNDICSLLYDRMMQWLKVEE